MEADPGEHAVGVYEAIDLADLPRELEAGLELGQASSHSPAMNRPKARYTWWVGSGQRTPRSSLSCLPVLSEDLASCGGQAR